MEPLKEKVHPPVSLEEGNEGEGVVDVLVVVVPLETKMLLGEIRAVKAYQHSGRSLH